MPKRKATNTATKVEPPLEAVSTARSERTKARSSGLVTTKRRKVVVEEAIVREEEPGQTNDRDVRPSQRKVAVIEEHADVAGDDHTHKVKRKRNLKTAGHAEAMPLAPRSVGHKLFIGAHVSSAGGVHNSIGNSIHIGGNAFALFLKSQRKWVNPPLMDDHCSAFHANCKNHSYDQARHVVPHGSYLVNLACTDKARSEQAYQSYVDDLKRCERLGISLYNIHPGNTLSNDRATAIAHLAMHINKAHEETSTVVTLLENMAAGGNVLGSTFEDLRDTIALVHDKSRVGVCIDTCHSFAAGYDLRSPDMFRSTMHKFAEIVGFKYLRAVHMNDSKAPFGSYRDLHANIGTGFLGLQAFHNIVNDSRFEGIPLVLETPIDAVDDDGIPIKDEKGKQKEDKSIWAGEIKMLESLVGMDTASDAFKELERKLARRGAPERKRLAEQQARKREEADKNPKSARKRKSKVSSDVESSLSDLEDER